MLRDHFATIAKEYENEDDTSKAILLASQQTARKAILRTCTSTAKMSERSTKIEPTPGPKPGVPQIMGTGSTVLNQI